MPPIENMLFEMLNLTLGFAILIKLWNDPNKFYFITFLFTVVFASLIEMASMGLAHSYYYAEFLFVIPESPNMAAMVGGTPHDFPIFIAISWGVIVYCLSHMTKRLKSPWYLLPFICGFMAVSIDMALDPVAASSAMVATMGADCSASTIPGAAEGIGFWVWCIPENSSSSYFFGIPLQNFYGWFLIVSIWVFFQEIAFRSSYESPWPVQFNALMTSTVLSLILFFGILTNLLSLGGDFSWMIWGTEMFIGLAVLVVAGGLRKSYVFNWWYFSVLISTTITCISVLVLILWPTASLALKVSTALWLIVSLGSAAWILRGEQLLRKSLSASTGSGVG